MVAILLAEGFEEMEALAPADLLRRAGVEVTLVGLDSLSVPGAHNIVVAGDCTLAELEENKIQMLVLPGGMGCVNRLNASQEAKALIERVHKNGKKIAAICAVPTVLAGMGLLEGRQAVCYPSCAPKMAGAAIPPDKNVVVDGNFITCEAAGSALDFGLALIETLCSKEKAQEVQHAVYYYPGEKTHTK